MISETDAPKTSALEVGRLICPLKKLVSVSAISKCCFSHLEIVEEETVLYEVLQNFLELMFHSLLMVFS